MRFRIVAALVLGLAGTALPITASTAALASPSSSTALFAVPGSGASLQDWQSYAAQERTALSNGTFEESQVAPTGCSLVSYTATPYAVPAPSGGSVQLDGWDGIVRCPVAAVKQNATSSLPISTATAYTPVCPTLTSHNGSSITNGYECVGAYSSGAQGYVGTSYTLEEAMSVTGHSEIGIWSTSCSVGGLAHNGATVTLTSTSSYWESYLTTMPVSYSNNWSGTWWKGSGGGPYSNWGTVCGTY